MNIGERRPRLLFISPRFLFPMDQGGKIRTGNILRGLKGGAFEVTLASPAPADVVRFERDLSLACDRFLPWPESPPARWRRTLALGSRLPVAAAMDRSAAGACCVRDALADRPDVVVVDFPHAGVLLPPHLDTPSVLFTHNVEAEIFERHAARSRGIWRLVWDEQCRKMRRFEGEVLRRCDRVIAVSRRDASVLAKTYDLPVVETVDTGVDLEFFAYQPPAPPPPPDGGTLVFTATMSWPANVDGIHFLLDEVWPLLQRARPAIQAVVIGRNPPPSLTAMIRERGLNVTLTGFVEDIRPFVAASHVYVIPLWVGSGTRIKTFEAMAMGRPVVSTTLGVEGLDVVNGQHLRCADSAPAFAAAILELLSNPDAAEGLARAARCLIEARFSWHRIARQFEAICLRAAAAPRRPR